MAQQTRSVVCAWCLPNIRTLVAKLSTYCSTSMFIVWRGQLLLTYLKEHSASITGALAAVPPTIPESQCFLHGESPILLPVSSNSSAEPLHLYQPQARRSSSTTLPTSRFVTGMNPVGGVVRRKPNNVTEHRHLALEDQLRDVFH